MNSLVACLVSIGVNPRDIGRAISFKDVATMVVKRSQLVALQIECMKNGYYFLKSEMGRPLKELELPRIEIVSNEEEHESNDEVLYRCIVSL
ncbi:hypothetical protein SLE2022_328630 [Rubroshorea leprosula]